MDVTNNQVFVPVILLASSLAEWPTAESRDQSHDKQDRTFGFLPMAAAQWLIK